MFSEKKGLWGEQVCQSFRTEASLCEALSSMNRLLKKIDHTINEAAVLDNIYF